MNANKSQPSSRARTGVDGTGKRTALRVHVTVAIEL